jgi:spermidine synthase
MMKKAMSYIWPMSKKIKTVHSGTLEISWLNGKKILNSKNGNYSYGSLEKVLDFGLSYSKAERSSEVLVLGLGGGSVLDLLRKKYKFYGKITAVEIDPAVIDIALSEFNIKQHGSLDLLCEDAFDFVQESKKAFGLIIIDIFIDVKVPEQFFSEVFWNDISRLLDDKEK